MSKKNVEILCERAANAKNGGEAQAYAEAALSVAQAMCTVKTADHMDQPPGAGAG